MFNTLFLRPFAACLALFLASLAFTASAQTPDKPLRALIVTGGCCHNYPFQADAISNAMATLAPVQWTVINEGGTGTRGEIDLYTNPDWAKSFDVVIHNECFADTTNATYIRKITEAHRQGVPAVVIHCAMHTYRAWAEDDWREFLGVTSRYHDHQSHYPVKSVAKDHPIMKGFPEEWKTPMDELYIIEKIWPGTKALATSASEKTGKEQPVFWIHDYHGARIFGTTFGHSDETFRDPVFLNTLSRGIMWAAGRLK
jgi:type 1 glutamine amidotransferase